MVIDTPPGTSDEHLSIVQYPGEANVDGAIIVTTPQVWYLNFPPPSPPQQFLKDVDWGDIDYMVIDTPPGTSDEHLSIVQYLGEANVDGAIIVTTPQV